MIKKLLMKAISHKLKKKSHHHHGVDLDLDELFDGDDNDDSGCDSDDCGD